MRALFTLAVVTIVGIAPPLLAQSAKTEGREVRLVGCVQWEKDYRRVRSEGRGGALGTGIGVGNEYVLTMVKPDGARKATAYGLTGDREKELGRRIGQQIEVIGVIEDEGKAGTDRFSDLPRINVTAWIPLKDSCSTD